MVQRVGDKHQEKFRGFSRSVIFRDSVVWVMLGHSFQGKEPIIFHHALPKIYRGRHNAWLASSGSEAAYSTAWDNTLVHLARDEKGCLNTGLMCQRTSREEKSPLGRVTELEHQKKVGLITMGMWRTMFGIQTIHLGISWYPLVLF